MPRNWLFRSSAFRNTTNMETWRSAFRRQAQSDYEMFQWMNRKAHPLCHQLHYLQMTAEKLAKAFLCGVNNRRPPTVHDALLRFMRTAKNMRGPRNASGMTKSQFGSYIDGLLPTADAIEKLVPEGNAVRSNPEYPWETAKTVISPLNYGFPGLDIRSPTTQKFLHFIKLCMDIA